MKLSLAVAALASSLVVADPPANPTCRVFCFRITDIRQDDQVADRFHFEFEVLNWADTFAGGVKLDLAKHTSKGIKFGPDNMFNFNGVDVDGRPLAYIDVNGDQAITFPQDYEDLNKNGILEAGEDKNGNGRLDNDPIPGNLNRRNNFFLFDRTDKSMEWRLGEPIPFINLFATQLCQDCIISTQSLPRITNQYAPNTPIPNPFAAVAFNPIDGSFNPVEAIDNGDNVQDGFVMTIDNFKPCKVAQINWYLLGAGPRKFPVEPLPPATCRNQGPDVPIGNPIGLPGGIGNNAGFGLISLVRLDANKCPTPPPQCFDTQVGFTRSQRDFFDDVFKVPLSGGGKTEFALEFSAGLNAPSSLSSFGAKPNTVETGKCGGDPHFRRWHQDKRDTFHGECDLVLLKSKHMDVHVRTTMEGSFSFIEAVAIRAGDHAVEFQNKHIYLDGEEIFEDSFPLDIGGYTIESVEGTKGDYRVYYSSEMFVTVSSHRRYMKAEVSGTEEHLEESMGILGDYGSGDMIGREGQLVENFFDFGFEWQVQPTEDGSLFKDDRAPQLPFEKCRMPTLERPSRRLGYENSELYKNAKQACAIHGQDMDLCIDDVLTTGDIDIVNVW